MPDIINEIIEQGHTSHAGTIEGGVVMTDGFQGSDLKLLPSHRAVPYMDALIYRFGNLCEAFFPEDPRFEKFRRRLLKLFQLIRLKHRCEEFGYVDLPFTIDPTESGWPHLGDLLFIEEDKKKIGATLAVADRAKLVKEMSDAIALEHRFPRDEQRALILLDYFEFLKSQEGDLFSLYKMGTPLQVKVKNPEARLKWFDSIPFRTYQVEWGGINSANLFVFNRMDFLQDGESIPFAFSEYPQLETLLKEPFHKSVLNSVLPGLGQLADSSLYDTFLRVDEIPDLRPKEVSRFIIGPYYNQDTSNTAGIQELFDGLDDPFVMKMTQETVRSLQSVPRPQGVLRQFFSRETYREVPSTVQASTYLLCSSEVKKRLVTKDWHGNRCTVIGLIRGGGLYD